MKVLVLNPGTFDGSQYIKEGRCESRKGAQMTVPVTLGVIAQLLRLDKFEVKLKDLMISPLGAKERADLFSDGHDVVILNTSTPTFEFDKKTARLIKKDNPRLKICAFGTVVSAIPELAFQDPAFDFVVRREAEITILELCKLLRRTGGYPKSKELYLIDGLCFRDSNRIVINPDRAYIDNLDILPFPARDLMENERYIEPKSGRPFTAVTTGRGCPYSCIFCTAGFYYGKTYRERSIENILAELEECVKKYGIKDFLLLADTFTANKERVAQLCQKITESGLSINWACNSRVDTLDLKTAKMMKKAGCWLISFGVESGDPEILKIIKKGIRPEDAIIASNICREAGIFSYMYYIYGLPGETRDSMRKTLDLAIKADSDFVRFYTATPLPGSELYNIASREGKIDKLVFSNFNLSSCDISLSHLSYEEIMKTIRISHIRFYFRAKYISRMLKSLSSKEIKNLFKAAFYYLKNIFKERSIND